MTDPSRPPQATAHTLRIDQVGRFLSTRKPTGAWALPSAAVTFDVPPFQQVVGLARRRLGVEIRERDLLVHVCAHGSQLDHGGIALVVSVGFPTGDPAPEPALNALPAQRWCPPRRPPRPLAAWDGMVLPALMTTSLTEVGWMLPVAQTA